MLHRNTVENDTLELLINCNNSPFLNQFFLVRGTALALQIGHRKSIDLDFFSTSSFDEELISKQLETEFNAKIYGLNPNSISGEIAGVKFDIISHQYPLIQDILVKNDIRLASLKDIAAMKLNAIQNRGSKKDFVDIYYLLQQFSLQEILSFHEFKYPNRDGIVALKSLVYFNDAELQPDCELTSPISWGRMKEFLEKKVFSFSLPEN